MARNPTRMTNHVEATVVLHKGLLSIAKPAIRDRIPPGSCQAATLGRPERLPGPPTGSTPRGRRRSLPPGPAPKEGLHPFHQRNYSHSTSRLPTLSSPHYGHRALIAASILPTAHPLTLIQRSAWNRNSPKFGAFLVL